MKLSNSIQWAIIVVFTILFIIGSMYRYHVVNAPYKDYDVIENVVIQNESIEVHGLQMTFGLPQLIEQDEGYTLEVPLTVVNKSSEVSQLSYEDFMITFNKYSTNGIGLLEMDQHPENKTETFVFDGVPPGEEGHAQLIFNLMKDWGVNEKTDISLFYVTLSDNIVKKYRLPYRAVQ